MKPLSEERIAEVEARYPELRDIMTEFAKVRRIVAKQAEALASGLLAEISRDITQERARHAEDLERLSIYEKFVVSLAEPSCDCLTFTRDCVVCVASLTLDDVRKVGTAP